MSCGGCVIGDWLTSPPEEKENKTDSVPRPASLFGNCGACGTQLESNRSPQLLPCLHSLCRPCVPRADRVDGRVNTGCPACGVEYSPADVTADLFYSGDSGQADSKCGGCGVEAGAWCMECVEALCPECVSAHKRVKVTREHKILTQRPPSVVKWTVCCSAHGKQAARFFCRTCDEPICRNCEQILHKGHRFMLLKQAVMKERAIIRPMMEDVRLEKNKVMKSLSDLDQRLLDLKTLQTKLNSEMRGTILRIRDALLKRAVSLAVEVQELCGSEERSILERREVLKKLEERQVYLLAFAKRTGAYSGEYSELLSYRRKIQQQLQDVISSDVSPRPSMLTAAFCCNSEIYSKIDTFGTLVVKTVPFACENGKGKQPHPPHKIQAPIGQGVLTAQTPPTSSPNLSAVSSSAQIPPTSCQTPPTSCQTPPIYPQKPPTFSQIPHTPNQIPPTSYQTPPTPSQTPPNPSQTPPNPSKKPPTSCKIPPTFSQIPPSSSQTPPTSSQIPPAFSQIPPSSSQTPPTSSQIPPAFSQIPPSSSQIPPTSYQTPLAFSQIPPTSSQIPPMFFYIHPMPSQIPPTSYSKAQLSLCLPLHPKPLVPSKLNAKSSTLSQPHSVSPSPSQIGPLPLFVNKCPAYFPPYQPKYIGGPPSYTPPLPGHLSPVNLPHSLPVTLRSSPYHPNTPTQNGQTASAKAPAFRAAANGPCGRTSPTIFQVAFLPGAQGMDESAVFNAVAGLTHPAVGKTSTGRRLARERAPPAGDKRDERVECRPASDVVGTDNAEPSKEVMVKMQVGLAGGITAPVATEDTRCNGHVTVNGASNWCFSGVPKHRSLHKSVNGQEMAGVLQFPGVPVAAASVPALAYQHPLLTVQRRFLERITPPPSAKPIKKETCRPAPSRPSEQSAAGEGLSQASDRVDAAERGQSQSPNGIGPTGCNAGASAYLKDMQQGSCPSPAQTDPDEQPQRSPTDLPIGSPYSAGLDPQRPIGSPGLAGSYPRLSVKFLSPQKSQRAAALIDLKDESDLFWCPVEEDDDGDKIGDTDVESVQEPRCLVPRVSLVQLPVSFAPPGHPLPQFHLFPSANKQEVHLEQLTEEDQPLRSDSKSSVQAAAPPSRPLPRSKLCVVCHEAGTLTKCSDCGRGFHHDCHLIPITTSDSDRWQCMVCEDLSDIRVHQSRVSERNPALDFPDQRKCEHVFLTLISTNYSALLYRQPELLPHSSRYVDIALIRDRLLQKLSPAYLSPSEFVSDVWLLLNTLSKSSNDAKPVARLQRTFQTALRKAFGTSLHPSLLEPPPGKEEEGAKVGTEARGSEEVRQTKKRKRKRKEESAEPLMKKICKDEERGGWME